MGRLKPLPYWTDPAIKKMWDHTPTGAYKHRLSAKKKRKLENERARQRVDRGLRYTDRDTILRSIGFKSYEDYLKSEFWANIRTAAIERHGKNCALCGKDKSIQVHHTRYDRATLIGEQLRFLVPVCRNCHLDIEFSGPTHRRRKRTMAGAIKHIYLLAKVHKVDMNSRLWM